MSYDGFDEWPRFDHECQHCVFLGPHDYCGHTFDLYFCAQWGYPTVLARASDKPADYFSGLPLSHCHPILGEAKTRAQRMGLLSLPKERPMGRRT